MRGDLGFVVVAAAVAVAVVVAAAALVALAAVDKYPSVLRRHSVTCWAYFDRSFPRATSHSIANAVTVAVVEYSDEVSATGAGSAKNAGAGCTGGYCVAMRAATVEVGEEAAPTFEKIDNRN